MKVITGMMTCKNADLPDDSSEHYIYAFEVEDDYKEKDPRVNVSVSVMQYSEIASILKQNKSAFVIKDETGKNLELYEKNGSIILKRDDIEFTKFKGNVRMNEHYDPGRLHE